MTEDFDGVIGIVYSKDVPKRYLIIYNRKTGHFTFPAGAKEEYETLSRQTLERELLEETGLTPMDYVVFDTPFIYEFTYGENKKERKGQKARQHVYFVETTKTKLKPIDSNVEIDGWYSIEGATRKLSFDELKKLFQKIMKFYKIQ